MRRTSMFLMGYFYASWESVKYNIVVDINEHYRCVIHTYDGGELMFAINRGICPIIGCVAYAFKEPESSFFDIVEAWTTKEIWNYIKLNHEVDEGGGVRIDFDDLCKLINEFGGINFNEM